MRKAAGVILIVALVGCLAVTAARFVDPWSRTPILLASFSVYALPGFALVLLGFLLLVRGAGRRTWLVVCAVLAAAGLVVQGWAVAPLLSGGEPASTDLTVMSSNLEFGRGEGATVTRVVAEKDVDVLVLVEVTPAALRGLLAAGLDDLLPHRAGAAEVGASGTMVFSRFPLESPQPLDLGNGGLEVDVEAAEPFRLLAVHPAQPVGWADTWLDDMATLRERAAAATAHGPTVVAGDFNATRDHLPFRHVLDTGVRDAAEEAGSGWQPSWPSRGSWGWLPPLLMIDHVLTGEHYRAMSTSAVPVQGSDHLALVARLHRTTAAG